MELKFKVGQKVKLNEKGIKNIFANSEHGQRFQNVIATINTGSATEPYPYRVSFPNGNEFTVKEDEIILAYEEDDSSFESANCYFETMGSEIGELVDRKQLAYGNSVDKTYRLMKIFLEKWENGDGTYTIPESLLKHMLLQVRLIDKQNRLFNNPDSDLMQENPYQDSVGYNMLGVRMVEEGK